MTKKTTLLILYFLITLMCICCKQKQEEDAEISYEAKVSQGTVIAVGDSLTAGYGLAEHEAYPALLEKKLQENSLNWQVLNAGISGETSSGMLSRMDWIIAQNPDIVILETGANDGLRGIQPSLVKENISKAVKQLQKADIEVVLAGMQIVRNLGPLYTKKFIQLYKDIAEEQDVILIPFFLKGVAGNSKLNQHDTIHPTAQGYKIVTENVYPYVVEAIEKR